MSWNYRLVIEREKDIVEPDEWVYSYSIRDVYYDDKGNPNGCGADPQPALGETLEEILSDIQHQAEACNKPVIFMNDDGLFTEPPERGWLWESLPKKDIPDSANTGGNNVPVPSGIKHDEMMERFERIQKQHDLIKDQQAQARARMYRGRGGGVYESGVYSTSQKITKKEKEDIFQYHPEPVKGSKGEAEQMIRNQKKNNHEAIEQSGIFKKYVNKLKKSDLF